MDVAAGRNVVVVLLQLGVIDDATEFLLFFPADKDIDDAPDTVLGDEVLGIAFFEDPAGVDEQHAVLLFRWFRLVQEQHDSRSGGVVKEVFREIEHAFDDIVIDEPLADALFLVGTCIARPARSGTGIEDDCCTTPRVQAGMDVLHPPPVGGGFAGKTGPGGKAVEFIVVVVGLGEPVLVPHRIGDDTIEGAEFTLFVAEFGIFEGIADLNLAFHVVNDHVHIGHGPCFRDVLLAKQFQRGKGGRVFQPAIT